jgi:hypothetical protein
MATKTITVGQDQIAYDANVNTTRGFFKDREADLGPPAFRRAPSMADGNRLLHILFFLVYTQEGRKLLDDNRTFRPEPEIRANVKGEIQKLFGGQIPDDVLEAIVKAHIAGDKYVNAKIANNQTDMTAQSTAYSEQLCLLLGKLHDDAMVYEFSCGW